MNTALHFSLRGLGQSAAQITNQVGGIAASTVPGVLLSVGAVSAAAVPFVGLAIAGVTAAIAALMNTGCGQTCIETSQWANQAEQLLQQNIAAYFASPAPRSVALQQAAMQNFQTVWNQLVQLCSQPGLGSAGQRCISDRQQGSCHYSNAAPPEYPGEPAAGTCWNWWNAYYTPIANDPNVSATSAAAPGPSTPATGGIPTTIISEVTSNLPLLLIAGGLLVVLMVAS